MMGGSDMERNLIDEIKKEISENKVVIYIKGTKEMPRSGFRNFRR